MASLGVEGDGIVNLFTKKTFCMVTGASHGLGRSIVVMFGDRLAPGSVMLLVARGKDNLELTKRTIDDGASGVEVFTCSMDLSEQNEKTLKQMLLDSFGMISSDPGDFDQAMIIHCAGTLGPVDKYVCELFEWQEVAKYFALHVTSVLVLTSLFLKFFDEVNLKTIVNISSLDAILPSKSRGLYGAARAAREMLFRTMAMENTEVRVLNYCPGPVDTNMQAEIRNCTKDPDVKKIFIDLHENNKLIKCEDSVSKLVHVLETNKFESGCRLDYYDL